MIEDPIVQEIRAAREAYAARFDFNVQAILTDLRKMDARGDHPIIAPPRNLTPATEPQTSKAGSSQALSVANSPTPPPRP